MAWVIADNCRTMYLFKIPLILRHFPFGGGMLYLKSINFLKFCPHVQCLAERWTTTDGEQTCNPRRTGSCPGSERDSHIARDIPQKCSSVGQSGTAVNLLENRWSHRPLRAERQRPGGVRWKNLAAAFKGADKRIRQGLFALQSAKYASAIFELPNLPDGVWQIELVALLRTAVHLW